MEWIYKKSQKKKIRGAGYQGISENLYETEKKCPGKPLACDSGNINMLTASGGGKGKKRGDSGTNVFIKDLCPFQCFSSVKNEWVIKNRKRY